MSSLYCFLGWPIGDMHDMYVYMYHKEHNMYICITKSTTMEIFTYTTKIENSSIFGANPVFIVITLLPTKVGWTHGP